ncbi:ImmA/IrrE family metallo-endopeptidase [Caballeronia sp. J97]|uniref:ImmA/IrrE family metallo-endopeptidase n=1 Tax=Caballeronia sp. J97 TaxID=2805429 RepID=UPI002AB28C88|nr:ImmA/IrrE family metallo-endopeptidase [Caballeronia sp. J97]
MQSTPLTPEKAAFKLTNVLNVLSATHGDKRFPVDVPRLAEGCHELFQWSDPITKVVGADLPGFDGCLSFRGEGKGWALIYNETAGSAGRIRFTQAHELGHYILHRKTRTSFECTSDDMDDWQAHDRAIENEADRFAANLLMPLDDFRKQISKSVDFDQIAVCASRYGVSLTAAALRWVDATDAKLVLVSSVDGFIRWSFSSKSARESGAFLRARKSVVEVPSGSLAAEISVSREPEGVPIDARLWFPDAHAKTKVREMKIASEQFGILSLIELPRTESVWAPWETK